MADKGGLELVLVALFNVEGVHLCVVCSLVLTHLLLQCLNHVTPLPVPFLTTFIFRRRLLQLLCLVLCARLVPILLPHHQTIGSPSLVNFLLSCFSRVGLKLLVFFLLSIVTLDL